MQTIFEKCPFIETDKLSKLFRLILRGLNLPAVSDTHRTKSCGVSDPAEQDLAGYQAHGTSLAGYQTPQNNDRYEYVL
jgi:hypothetical protein